MSGQTISPAAAALHPANVFGSPGSTWAGAAAILAVVSQAMANGLPTSPGGWMAFGAVILAGVGGIFSKA